MTRFAITECTTFNPFGDNLTRRCSSVWTQPRFFSVTQVDRHAAPRDVEAPGNVGHAGPAAIRRSHLVDREEVMCATVRQLVCFEFLPDIHWCLIYHTIG